ncbi:hypothetical protein ACOI1H_03440 [Loktanella sp. DJP18]|uniref:hypothetical protein n=1 Tax=Loktanella sp. DJP18 TaxID=3409788 RepID=UPI003BB75083
MRKILFIATAALISGVSAISAQTAEQPETGSGNPTLTCTQFLEMEPATQTEAIATLMTVGSNEMPPADAGADSGDVGNMTSSDTAAAPTDEATATENADTGADNAGMTNVSPEVLRAMVNLCRNSAEPS